MCFQLVQILVLRLPQFLHAPTQNFKDQEKSTNSCDSWARKAIGGPKELPYLCCVSPLKSSRDSSTLVSTQSSTHCSLGSRRAFDTAFGRRPGHPADTGHRGYTLLTQDIDKKKAGAVFVDLTAAYDTVWHRGLTCKLLQLLPDRHMVRMIMEMVGNRSFTLTTGNGKSRLRRLKNCVPQGSVQTSLLSNTYISDLPTTVSRKYAYADDLAIMHANGDWQAVEGVLTKDLATVGLYLQTWNLKLSTTKTVSAASILTTRKLNVSLKSNTTTKPCPSAPSPNTSE